MPSVPKYELNADMLRDVTQKTVQATVSIKAEGYRCDGDMLVDVLIKAASENSSVEAACRELSNVVDSNTLPERLNEQVEMVMVATLPKQRGGKRQRKWLAYVVLFLPA